MKAPLVLAAVLLLLLLVRSDAFRPLHKGRSATHCSGNRSRKSSRLFDDDDEGELRSVLENYLDNKYRDCKETGPEGSMECRFACDRKDIEDLLVTLLPPVSKEELKLEVDTTMERFRGMSTVDPKVFYNAIVTNTYWERAGPLVVKELIYLDSLYAYHRGGQMFLGDDEYNQLKEMLTWEGSSIVTMKGSEALFITAVAAYLRGRPILNDAEYEQLKASLRSEKSWVVERKQDTLEKLGLDTFLGYLHRSL